LGDDSDRGEFCKAIVVVRRLGGFYCGEALRKGHDKKRSIEEGGGV
jgi:hypothetical protein